MKRLILASVMAFFLSEGVFAQGFPNQNQNQKFSPEKYQADMEQYIAKEAGLTPQEAAAFFPLFREMQQKQRALYNQMMAEVRIKPADEKACKKIIQKRDQVELELKSIQQTYHNKFFSVMPASKVFDVITAEDKFHRGLFRNWGRSPAIGGGMGTMGTPRQGNRQGNQGFRR